MPSTRGIWYRAFAYFLVASYAATIFYLSSKPSVPVPMWFENQDKLYHFIEYNILAFLIAHATERGTNKRRFWIALSLASLYGASDELHQSFVPPRECSWGDWIADTVGAWSGAYLYLKSETILRKRRSR